MYTRTLLFISGSSKLPSPRPHCHIPRRRAKDMPPPKDGRAQHGHGIPKGFPGDSQRKTGEMEVVNRNTHGNIRGKATLNGGFELRKHL